jgi:hypothetical protein
MKKSKSAYDIKNSRLLQNKQPVTCKNDTFEQSFSVLYQNFKRINAIVTDQS